MDPITLLAAASAAVKAVKRGCELYKEAQGVVGNVKEVLEDLRKQFNSKPRTKEEKKQYDEEVQRVKQTATQDPQDNISAIGEHLGAFFDAYDKIEALFWEEERKAKLVYTGSESLGKRALQRVLIRTRLEIMQKEIREEMIYRTPPELKELYGRFEKMREQILAEQREAKDKELRAEQAALLRRRRMIEQVKEHAAWAGAITFVLAWTVALLILLRTSHTYRGFS